jgi:hypothetical protein
MKLHIPGSIGIVLAAALSASFALEERIDGKELVLSLSAQPMSDVCYSCIACSTTQHDMHNDTPHRIFQIAHACAQGGDHECDTHPACSGELEPDELGKLWAALQTFDGAELHAIMDAYPQVEYNRRRSVFQVRRCGALVGQLPLNSAQLNTLAED